MSSIIYQPKSTNNDPTLYLFIINARNLSIRREKIKVIVKQIADNYKYRVIPKFISSNDPVDIEPKLASMNDRFSYEPSGDVDFDRLIEVLNIETLSNIFKHNDVWQSIATGVYNTNDLFLVIEDDIILVEQNIQSLRDVLEYVTISSNNSKWDILFPGLAQPANVGNQEIELTPVSSVFKVIPSKESYFINKQSAEVLLKIFNESKITYSLRVQLSKFLFNNKDTICPIKAMIPNRRCTIDGSKLGFFPTSIHNNNILLYNGEYMELYKLFMLPVSDIKQQLSRVKQIYNMTKHISSPDITHLYAVILMKLENYDEAEDILKLALDQTRQAQGIINNRCDICNNIINLYEKQQDDIKAISKNPSKYSNYNLIPLKD